VVGLWAECRCQELAVLHRVGRWGALVLVVQWEVRLLLVRGVLLLLVLVAGVLQWAVRLLLDLWDDQLLVLQFLLALLLEEHLRHLVEQDEHQRHLVGEDQVVLPLLAAAEDRTKQNKKEITIKNQFLEFLKFFLVYD